MTKTNKLLLLLGLCTVAFGVVACGDDNDDGDTGMVESDTPAVDTGGTVITADCAGYCTQTMANCTDTNAQYDDEADCLAFCNAAGWPAGTPGEAGGNTLACRIYHGGDPASGDPAMHCPHAGPTGANVCGDAIPFRTDAATAFTRVDRMGMPAVATALVPSASRNDYNNGGPSDDAVGTFAGAALGTLTAIHAGLDDDLTAAGLTPCSMTETIDIGPPFGPVPACAGQPVVGGGPPVASLVIPDTLQVNPAMPAGFPNGRDLDDRVIDVTLAVILLDLESATGCAGGPCTAGTIAGLSSGAGLNPAANDVDFSTTFPYLAVPHAP
jgi:hypothetical protein